jgi:ABC-type uncharacterized transport system substrate-binding protein
MLIFKGYRLIMIFITLFVLMFSTGVSAGNKADFKTQPVTNNGHKWRIGYYEGGSYSNYPIQLEALIEGLVELGWMQPVDLKSARDEDRTAKMWRTLAALTDSRYLEFVESAYWSSQWDDTVRKERRAACLETLKTKKLDFIIAMGTWAGQDLANNQHTVPLVGIDISDPLKSGVIASTADSGFDHVYVRCDPDRELRKLRIFHSLVGFKKLGIAFVNSADGRAYAAVDDIYKVAAGRKFQVITCDAPISDSDTQKCVDGLYQCHAELAAHVDAIFITTHRGMAVATIKKVLSPMFRHKIPTFSQRGVEEVEYGVLMSISTPIIGLHHAKVIASIFNGVKPRNIDQVFKDPLRIAINMETARRIGYTPPKNIFRITDAVYENISVAAEGK